MEESNKVKRIIPVSEDERGKIIDVIDGEEFVHAGIVTFKSGVIRGNHFHKKTEQVNYILKGKIRYRSKNLTDEKSSIEEFILNEGDTIVSKPLEWHSLEALEESILLFFTKKARMGGGYEEDVFRIPPEEIGKFKIEKNQL